MKKAARSPSEFLVSSNSSSVKPRTPQNAEEIVIPNSETTVLEFDSQPGTRLYIANHGPLRTDRPGNGGMRLFSYKSQDDAVADCIRLAEGMTRKHSMYRTGFSGAKLVVHADDVEQVDKAQLMKDAAIALESLQGSIYTGCDMNTTDEDMEVLSSISPYVLAGIGSRVDTNHATASSVIGSILGALEATGKKVQDCKFVVQGCGKVGSIVARELTYLRAGHVVTCDINAERSFVGGCENLLARKEGENMDWRYEECDIFVPCAGSLSIDELAARVLKADMVIGSANSPYASIAVRKTLDAKGVFFVPESISSAGAILADSVEWVDQETFRTITPELCYRWVRDVSQEKTRELFQKTGGKAELVSSVIDFVAHDKEGIPMGCTFNTWREKHTHDTTTLIIGTGGVAAATALQCSLDAKKDHRVTLVHSKAFDCWAPADDLKSDRMHADPLYRAMEDGANAHWGKIEEMSDIPIPKAGDCLIVGQKSLTEDIKRIKSAKEIYDEQGFDHKEVDGEAITSLWGGLSFKNTEDYEGLYMADKSPCEQSACNAMLSIAKDNGCELHLDDEIASIKVMGPGCVEVVTKQGIKFNARNCILCLGPTSNKVLSENFGLNIEMTARNVHTFQYEVDSSIVAAGGYPGRFHMQSIAGMPECGNLLGKVITENGKHFLRVSWVYPEVETSAEVEDAIKNIDEWIRNNFEGIGRLAFGPRQSKMLGTDDSYFIIDKIPGIPEVSVFAGGCGRSPHLAPVIGECLRALTLDQPCRFDLDRFAIDRLVV